MNVYWFEQSSADVPADNDWLTDDESLCLSTLRFVKRRADWRLGRWTAKCAISAYLDVPYQINALRRIELVAAPCGAPEAFVDGEPAGASISISHREGMAICAVGGAGSIGCDLEVIEPRSDAFKSDYFTAEEQALFLQAPSQEESRLLGLYWSSKESTLKALRSGLRIDTRSVSVTSYSETVVNGWSRFRVSYISERCHSARLFEGWWQTSGRMVRTVVADAFPDPPFRLVAPLFARADLMSARMG